MALDLSRLKRCEQDWHTMQPSPRGRQCAACCREIVDFRGMSDGEIARIHAASPAPVCGVYSRTRRAGRAEPLAAAVALAALLPGAANAQPSVRHATELPGTARAQATDTLRLRGTVVDGANGRTVHGALVVNVDTEDGTISDSVGRFELVVPMEAQRIRIRVMLIGYGTTELDIPRADALHDIVVSLTPQAVDMIAFYITTAPAPASLLRRIWRFIAGSR